MMLKITLNALMSAKKGESAQANTLNTHHNGETGCCRRTITSMLVNALKLVRTIAVICTSEFKVISFKYDGGSPMKLFFEA